MGKVRNRMIKVVTATIITALFASEPVLASQEGWVENPDGTWSYMHNGTFFKHTWLQLNGQNWFYFKEDGTMATGWIKDVSGKWFYLYSNGEMASNTTIDGYKLNNSGEWRDDGGETIEESKKIDSVEIAPSHGMMAINFDNIQVFRDGSKTEIWVLNTEGVWDKFKSLATVPSKEIGKDDNLKNGIPGSISYTDYSYTTLELVPKGHEYVIAVKWKPRYRGVNIQIYKDNFSENKENELLMTKDI